MAKKITNLTPKPKCRTAAEVARFQAWLKDRQISTAPVVSWPPDETDFYGGKPRPRKVR